MAMLRPQFFWKHSNETERTHGCLHDIFFFVHLVSLVWDSGHRGCSPASSQSTIGPLYRQRCTSDTCLLQNLAGKQWKVVTNKKESPVFSQTLVIFQWPMILGKISSGWISLSVLRLVLFLLKPYEPCILPVHCGSGEPPTCDSCIVQAQCFRKSTWASFFQNKVDKGTCSCRVLRTLAFCLKGGIASHNPV